jgi:ATP-dependent RNA helicase RhlE
MTTTFRDLGLSSPVLQALERLQFTTPTPIQSRSIPLLLRGRDLIGSAQTGTGKTAAFTLPILTQLFGAERGLRALVLVPTRELACQVADSIRTFARFTPLVATPGRLLDHISRRSVDLCHIKHLVLDEADRMLDMGFLPDVRRVVGQLPGDRQTALFSATIPPQIEGLIRWAMKCPETVEIGQRRSPAETVRHALYPVAEVQKADLLKELLSRSGFRSTIVFCRTKHRADRVGRLLERHKHAVAVIHSNRSQRQRDQALAGFRVGRFKILVATDIAARGLDVPSVSHVINYDVPSHPEDYVHRIGRTGRAQAEGDAFTIVVAGEANQVRAIERLIGKGISHQKLENFNYQHTSLFEPLGRDRLKACGKAQGGRIHGGSHLAVAKAVVDAPKSCLHRRNEFTFSLSGLGEMRLCLVLIRTSIPSTENLEEANPPVSKNEL